MYVPGAPLRQASRVAEGARDALCFVETGRHRNRCRTGVESRCDTRDDGLAAPQSAARSSAALRESAVDLPGVRLWYADSGGSGVPVVFMHAATGSVKNWEHQVGALTAAGYRFIAFDRRGWGRTVIELSGPQPGTAADDLEGLVKHLGIDRFHLVGTAAGGFVALDYAVSFASRLRSVVVANSIGEVQDEEVLRVGTPASSGFIQRPSSRPSRAGTFLPRRQP